MNISKIDVVAICNKEKIHLNYLGLHLFINFVTIEDLGLISKFNTFKEAWDFLEGKYGAYFS